MSCSQQGTDSQEQRRQWIRSVPSERALFSSKIPCDQGELALLSYVHVTRGVCLFLACLTCQQHAKWVCYNDLTSNRTDTEVADRTPCLTQLGARQGRKLDFHCHCYDSNRKSGERLLDLPLKRRAVYH